MTAPDEDYGPVKARYTDSRIVWLRLETNGGQAAARNIGVDRAKGRMVAFIDQDDRWYPERLERGLEAFKDCVMTYSDYRRDRRGRLGRDAEGARRTPARKTPHQLAARPAGVGFPRPPRRMPSDQGDVPRNRRLRPGSSRATRTMIFSSASSGWDPCASSKRRCSSTAYTRRATGRAAGWTQAGATTSASS